MDKVSSTPCSMPEEAPGAVEKCKAFNWLVGKEQRGLWVAGSALTAVDRQVDVTVLCSQGVHGGAAIQAGCLR